MPHYRILFNFSSELHELARFFILFDMVQKQMVFLYTFRGMGHGNTMPVQIAAQATQIVAQVKQAMV